MKTRKNLWAAMVIAGIWGAWFIFAEIMRYTEINVLAFIFGGFFALFLTYQVLRALQYIPDVLEKQETVSRAQRRVDQVVSTLDERELDLLRDRLADLDDHEFERLEDLLVQDRGKRKNG